MNRQSAMSKVVLNAAGNARNVVLSYSLYLFLLMASLISACGNTSSSGEKNKKPTLKVKKTKDFEVSGSGTAANWEETEWIEIPQRTFIGEAFATKAKILYSDKGIYFLFDCEDKRLTATMEADFMELWNEDVVEVFLWPDDSHPFYFEYELSPLNYELPLMVSNHNLDLALWQPFMYEGERKTRHATSVRGGEKEKGAVVKGWMAEFFIPYQLLRPLKNITPVPGAEWRVNLYRIDYDTGDEELWSWQPTSGNFHEIETFGTLLFE